MTKFGTVKIEILFLLKIAFFFTILSNLEHWATIASHLGRAGRLKNMKNVET